MSSDGIVRAKYFGPETKIRDSKTWTFRDYFVGTFCFSHPKEFGCGDESSLEQGETIPLDNILDEDVFRVKYATQFKPPFSWSYKSKDCEYCRPQICFPESNLVIWRTVIRHQVLWKQEFFDPIFNQGVKYRICKNCTHNDSACNCAKPGEGLLESKSNAKHITTPSTNLVINPIRITPDQGPVSQVDDVASLFTPEYLFPSGYSIQNIRVAVVDSSRIINWLYPSDISGHRISLISYNPLESVGNEILSVPRANNQVPVLALTQYVNGPKVEAQVIANIDPTGKEEHLEPNLISINAKSDLFTVIYGNFTITSTNVTAGNEVELRITLKDEQDRIVSYLAQKLKIEGL